MTAAPEAIEGGPNPLCPRACFFGPIPEAYLALNRALLKSSGPPAFGPAPADAAGFLRSASLEDLDRKVKILPLPDPIPAALSAEAIRGMERLRELDKLTALRGGRATDLPRPAAGRLADLIRSHAPALIDLVEQVERILAGGPLFVRAAKLDRARASSTSASENRAAANLHFDAEKSSLSEYPEPVFQFYLNAGQRERQFRILPVARETVLESVPETERMALPLGQGLDSYLANEALAVEPRLETIPVESGALVIFDGRRFAHDAGKCDVAALLEGRFEPSVESDLVLALDTVETGYHVDVYRPDLPFFEDVGA
ncbi:MAG: hypothetical protein ACE5GX_20260 [Thermoanaerobaculia bacterium]